MKNKALMMAGVACLLTVSVASPQLAHASTPSSPVSVNLDHLNALYTTLPYPQTPLSGHSTVDPGKPLGTWWVYANAQSNGSYQPVGGGSYDAQTNTWGQGVGDTDDVARIAIVYLTHYQDYHDKYSLDMAYQALRFVIYMQINSGPNKGNFVNWIEPNGQPNMNPQPSEDTGNTFDWWAARSLWAMAEGYHVYRNVDPAFAKVLQSRINMAIDKLGVQVAAKYGQFYNIHGYRLPAWLISDGSDASSVATLGLVQYYRDTNSPAARKLIQQLGVGIQDSQVTSAANQWPYNAHMPWQHSVDIWEAWGNRQVMALAEAGQVLNNSAFITSAKGEADSLYPHMILSYGPDNGWLPVPDDQTQIAYGAESVVDSLLTLSDVTKNPTYAREAGVMATWYLGNNRAHHVMYNSATGATFDGINNDGTVNQNSGAESTLTALLALMDVESNPTANRYLSYDKPVAKTSPVIINGDTGLPSDGASIQTAPQQWTGEAQWRDGRYAQLVPGSSVTYHVTVSQSGMYLVQLSYDKQQLPLNTVGVQVYCDGGLVGTIDQGGAAAQGDSPNPDYLWMRMLTKPVHLTKGVHTIRLQYTGAPGHVAKVDSFILQPMIEREVLQNSQGQTVVMTHNMLNSQTSVQ